MCRAERRSIMSICYGLAFSLEKDANVDLRIFDVTGATIRALLSKRQDKGVRRINWDGGNDRGEPVASGVYFYRLNAGSFRATKKMVMLQ